MVISFLVAIQQSISDLQLINSEVSCLTSYSLLGCLADKVFSAFVDLKSAVNPLVCQDLSIWRDILTFHAGMEVLGIPIGSHDFITLTLLKQVVTWVKN